MRTVTYNPETFDHDVEQTRDWFRGRRNLLITTHLRPDGDALGSVFAATDCLRNEGIDCTPYLAEPLADDYQHYTVSGTVCNEDIDLSPFDGLLCLDCANENRLALPPNRSFNDITLPCCNIDHHIDNSRFGHVNVIHAESASTTELLATMFGKFGYPVSPAAATSLILGLVMDTGGFRFNNTTAASFRCAANLIDGGADYTQVMHSMFFNEPMELLRLKGEVFKNLKFAFDGRFVYFSLTPDLLERCGATAEMAEDLIDSVRIIRGVEITCRMQQIDDITRFSLRSQNPDLPILGIAHKLGGGGHLLAAGATQTGISLEEAEAQLLEYVGELLAG